MRTNREKYEHFWGIVNAKDAAEIEKLFPGGLPRQYFCIDQHKAKARDVIGIGRYRKGVYQKDSSEKISRDDVKEATRLAEYWHPPTPEDVCIHFQELRSYGKTSGADSVSKINAGDGVAWTAEQLEPEINRLKELYEPREGHAPCAYCRKQNPLANLVDGKVIYRMNGGVHTKTQKYCSDKPCASHDQMGHEG